MLTESRTIDCRPHAVVGDSSRDSGATFEVSTTCSEFSAQLDVIEAIRADNVMRERILKQQINRVASWEIGVLRA